MRRFIISIIIVSFLFVTAGCEIDNNVRFNETGNASDSYYTEDNAEDSAEDIETVLSDGTFTEEVESDKENETVHGEGRDEQWDHDIYSFPSPDRLKLALINDDKGYNIRQNMENVKKEYVTMIDRFENGELTLKYPVIDGYDRDFLTQDVLLWTKEMYSMPWIWYRRWYDNKIMVVQITYLENELLEYSKNHTISEIIEYVSPDSANVDDYYLYPSSIVKISEETVETVNGKVTVMVQEMVTDRVFLRFVWQDMLVIIFGSKEDVYAELVSRLDFMDVE